MDIMNERGRGGEERKGGGEGEEERGEGGRENLKRNGG